MNKQINFQVIDKTQLTERIIEYFTKAGFKCIEINEYNLKFIHSSSFFDTWATNPLKWGSEIIVSLYDNEVTAVFCIDTESQMKSVEEENVWNVFIDNFRTFLRDKKDLNIVTKKEIANVKTSRLIYVGWTILGVIAGGLTGMFLTNLTGSKMMGYFTIPIMATFFLTRSINFRRKKNAL